MKKHKWGKCPKCSPKDDNARLSFLSKEWVDYENNRLVIPEVRLVWKCENCDCETPFRVRKRKDLK